MSFSWGNGFHVEWGSLDLAREVFNVAQVTIVTTPLITDVAHTKVIKFAGNASQGAICFPGMQDTVNIGAGTSNHYIYHMYVRWSNINPGTEYSFLHFQQIPTGDDDHELDFILETDGDIRIEGFQHTGTIATITSPLTVDVWHRFDVRFLPDYANDGSGEIEIWLDGSVILSNTTSLDLALGFQMDCAFVQGPKADGGDMFFGGAVWKQNSTVTADRIEDHFEFLGPYTVDTAKSSTPDTGPGNSPGNTLDIGTWGNMGEVPPSGNSGEWDSTTPAEAAVYFDGGSNPGPSGDSRIESDGQMAMAQYIWNARRGNGGATTHYLKYGNKTSNYDAAGTYTPSASFVSTYKPFYAIIVNTSLFPNSSEDALMGMGYSGARDLECAEMALFILHLPTAPDPPDPSDAHFSGLILAGWF